MPHPRRMQTMETAELPVAASASATAKAAYRAKLSADMAPWRSAAFQDWIECRCSDVMQSNKFFERE